MFPPALHLPRRTVLRGLLAAPLLGACTPAREVQGGFVAPSPERGHRLRDTRSWPPPGRTRQAQVLIAGAGVAGLAAARALRQRGVEDIALLELEDQAGGNSRPGSVQGLPCPWGAHYLPVPGDDAPEVQALLEELGLRRRVAGRWTYDERHLCHAPQERLFFRGHWQEGLLPLQDVGAATLAQYRRFSEALEAIRRAAPFAIPSWRAPHGPAHRALDAIPFSEWLARQALDDPQLRWYLDYCCRDDYGAGIDTVSAWAGLHYFGARHGFELPSDAAREAHPPLTWAEGNGWLTRALATPLGDRVHTGRAVLRIAEQRHRVELDALDFATGGVERWTARHCIVALPVFLAARVLENPPEPLCRRAAATRHAPWLVANLHLDAPLSDAHALPRAWDNVIHGSAHLGYVDATHQGLNPVPGPTVLTWYSAPGLQARKSLLDTPWTTWRDRILAELTPVHPDLPARLTRIDIARYGHAMAVPLPGTLAQAGPPPRTASISFAHADWAGYSVFEEAFTLGEAAGVAAAGRNKAG